MTLPELRSRTCESCGGQRTVRSGDASNGQATVTCPICYGRGTVLAARPSQTQTVLVTLTGPEGMWDDAAAVVHEVLTAPTYGLASADGVSVTCRNVGADGGSDGPAGASGDLA